MTYPSLAIIGTAGRKEDKPRLTRFHYNRMVRAAIRLIEKLDMDRSTLRLVSGGAAWADHVAVTLATLGVVSPRNVTLYLPCELGSDGYIGTDEKSNKTASTANYYHKIFSEVTGHYSIQDLINLKTNGGLLDPGNGNFFSRNTSVANDVSPNGALLAYTFGNPLSDQPDWTIRPFGASIKGKDAGLKDGGTNDTWDKCQAAKFHCRLGDTHEDISAI